MIFFFLLYQSCTTRLGLCAGTGSQPILFRMFASAHKGGGANAIVSVYQSALITYCWGIGCVPRIYIKISYIRRRSVSARVTGMAPPYFFNGSRKMLGEGRRGVGKLGTVSRQ